MFLSISQLYFFQIGSMSNRVLSLQSQGGYSCLNLTPLVGSPAEQSFWIFSTEAQVFTPSLAVLSHSLIPEPITRKKCTDWSKLRSPALPLHPIVRPQKNLAD